LASDGIVEAEEVNEEEAEAATERNFKILEEAGRDSYATNYDENEDRK